MKTTRLTVSLLALLMLGITALTSCSKDDDMRPQVTFDINNPEGYFLYYKGGGLLNGLYEFLPAKKIRTHSTGSSNILQYTVVDNNIDIEGGIGTIRFVIEGDSVWNPDPYYTAIALIRPPESNQLAGKTFAGTYYNTDMSVLHPNFFYGFAAGGNTVDAGFTVGTTLRTEDYTSIGSVAARAELENGDIEFMVLVNGKLEVNYRTSNRAFHYGTFARQ